MNRAMHIETSLFLLQIASTLGMVGVIWMVQVVQYPLFARTGQLAFRSYHLDHSRNITRIVGPLMLGELASSLALCFSPKLYWIRPGEAVLGLAVTVAIWLITAMMQVPQHEKLANGFDPETHEDLVAGNWIRTLLWSLRGGLVLVWVSRLLESGPGFV